MFHLSSGFMKWDYVCVSSSKADYEAIPARVDMSFISVNTLNVPKHGWDRLGMVFSAVGSKYQYFNYFG